MALLIVTPFFLPGSVWLSVPHDGLKVHDAVVGSCPKLEYSREIRRPFVGVAFVRIDRVLEHGVEEVFVTDLHANRYSPRTILPDDLSLCWLLWHDHRLRYLDPGQYQATVVWNIVPYGAGEFMPDRWVVRHSNVFSLKGA